MPQYTRRRLIATGLSAASISAISGCLSGGGSSSEATAQTSFFVFGDFASEVAGDVTTAETLVPVGQHGHGWEPGPQIQGTIRDSDLFIYGMEGFQPWADAIVPTLRDDDADVSLLAAGSGIDRLEGEHDHSGETPWEWAGLYHLDAGSYTYTFQPGPDPEMQLAVLETDEGGDHGVHHVEETAHTLYESDHDAHSEIQTGGTLTPSSESLYHLQFADSGASTYTLDIPSSGHYVLFSQHVPSEFDAALTDDSGSSVDPEVTESAGGHDHEGEHETGTHEGEDGHGHDHSGEDPHFWLDPARAKQAVSTIRSGFVDVDGDNASAYADNAESYRSRLDELDGSFESTLNNASKDVVFVAGHNAFQYLGQRYGFEVETLTGLSPDDQPTPQDIERAQEIIAEHDLEYVCADPLESQQAANQLVAETDATEVLPLTPIPGQTQEWADQDWGYVEIMENVNLETLSTALDA